MAPQTDNSADRTLLQVSVESGFKEKVRVEAAKAGKSMSQFVRDSLRTQWNGTLGPNKDPNDETYDGEPSGDFSESSNGNESGNSEGVYEPQQDGQTESPGGRDSESSEPSDGGSE